MPTDPPRDPLVIIDTALTITLIQPSRINTTIRTKDISLRPSKDETLYWGMHVRGIYELVMVLSHSTLRSNHFCWAGDKADPRYRFAVIVARFWRRRLMASADLPSI